MGVCVERHHLAIVMENMEQGSLFDHLHKVHVSIVKAMLNANNH